MYRALILPVFLAFFTSEKIGITEHSVLPDPVGAMTRQSFFCKIIGDAFF
jgi:hypothetical protein